MRLNSKLCLSFGRGKLVFEGNTDAYMVDDLDGKKYTSGYLFSFAGEPFHGNPSYKNVLFYPQQKQST